MALFQTHMDAIDLVLLDVVMPEMGGVEAAEQMHAERPHLPVIFITGYDFDAISGAQQITGARILGKPVATPNLARALREMVG